MAEVASKPKGDPEDRSNQNVWLNSKVFTALAIGAVAAIIGMKVGKKFGKPLRTVAKGAMKLSIVAGSKLGSAVAGAGKGFGRLYAEAKAETKNAGTANAIEHVQARA